MARRSAWLALLISACLSAPCLLSVRHFFYSDDWVHLHYNGAIPPWEVWRFFSPEVVWFYRPLQALQFALFYHVFDLRPLPYNLCLWLMHLGVCALVFALVSRLTTHRVALLTTALFSGQWLGANVMLWCSNINTLHWALTTLGLCLLFLRYLQERRRSLLVGVYVLFFLNFLTKEAAVNAPVLLLLIGWWYTSTRPEPVPVRASLHAGIRLLGPFFALTVLFVAAHHGAVQDIYEGYVRPGYRFVSPTQAVSQTLVSFNRMLLSFHRDPVILPLLPWLRSALSYGVEHGLIFPFVLAAVAWRTRNRLLGFAILWTLVTFLPAAWLNAFQMHRFFYLPAVGSSLILALGARGCWRAAGSEATARPVRLLVPAALAYMVLVNGSIITLTSLRDRPGSDQMKAVFAALRREEGRLPRGSLVVIRNLSPDIFTNGLGVTEMVRLALRDSQAQGVLDGQRMPPEWMRRLDRIPTAYLLDCGRQPLRLSRIDGGQDQARQEAPKSDHRKAKRNSPQL